MQGQALVLARTCAGKRRLDGLAGAREDGEDTVTEKLTLDGSAGVLANDAAQDAVEVKGFRAECGVAEALGEGGGVGDVGEEDDGSAGSEACRLRLVSAGFLDEVLDQ